MKSYHWAILGTGTIGNEMAEALLAVHGELYGVSNRTIEKAEAFAGKYHVKKVFDSCDALLADPKVDIVYIATPHNSHFELMKKAIEAGKHVLCEKAITINSEQLRKIRRLAQENRVFAEEAMTIYHMPLYREIKKRIDLGDIGKVKLIQVNFGSCKEYDKNNRFFSKELAGGALLDIGVYALSFARYFMEEAPNQVLSTAQFFETGVDEQSGILLSNRKGQLAVTALTMRAKQPKRGVIAGEKGTIEIFNYPRADTAVLTCMADGKSEEIRVGSTEKALQYEIMDMEALLDKGTPGPESGYTLDVMETMTELRRQWGLSYPFEAEAH